MKKLFGESNGGRANSRFGISKSRQQCSIIELPDGIESPKRVKFWNIFVVPADELLERWRAGRIGFFGQQSLGRVADPTFRTGEHLSQGLTVGRGQSRAWITWFGFIDHAINPT